MVKKRDDDYSPKKSNREKKINFKHALGIAVIVLLAVSFILFYDSPTGQVTSSAADAGKQQVQQAAPSPAPSASSSDPRLDKCNDLSSQYSGQAKADFLSDCSEYLWKLCFSDNDCGPFHCTGNKCQVS